MVFLCGNPRLLECSPRAGREEPQFLREAVRRPRGTY